MFTKQPAVDVARVDTTAGYMSGWDRWVPDFLKFVFEMEHFGACIVNGYRTDTVLNTDMILRSQLSNNISRLHCSS